MANIQPPTSNYITQGKHGQYNAVDYAARTSRLMPTMNNRNIYAVEDGKITSYGWHTTMGNRLELTSTDGKRRWGFGHLESASVKAGATVKRGQLIGVMGHTGYTIPSGYYGTHLHLVCVSNGKYVYPPNVMNTAFSIYVAPQPSKMPPIRSKIQLLPVDVRTTYKAGTTKAVGAIKVTDGTYIYTVRGYDPVYGNRILINSVSAGGSGVALALYYTSGERVPGWKQL